MVCLSFKALLDAFPPRQPREHPGTVSLCGRPRELSTEEGIPWRAARRNVHASVVTCCYLCMKVTPIYHVSQHFKPKHNVDARAWFSVVFSLGRETLPFYTSLNALAFSSLLIHQHNLWSSRLTMTVKIWGWILRGRRKSADTDAEVPFLKLQKDSSPLIT